MTQDIQATTDERDRETDRQDSDAAVAAPLTFGGVFRRLGPAGVLAVIAASLPAIGGFVLLGSISWVAPWLRDHGDLGIALYIAGFAVLAGLAILPTYAQAFVGGWAFGLVTGSLAAISGFFGGSIIGYFIARRASGVRALDLIAEQPKWKAVYEALLGGGFWKSLLIVTLLRIPPNSPFAMTNLVMAATRVRPVIFFIGTLVGMAPRTAAVAYVGYLGQGLASPDAKARPLWLTISGIVLAVVVIVIIGAVANRAITRVTGQQGLAPTPSDDGPEPAAG